MENTKKKLADYTLRRLGSPVIQINISEDQLNDAINDSIDMFNDYASDACEDVMFSVMITEETLNTQYVKLPDDVYSVSRVFTNNGIMTGKGSTDPLTVGNRINSTLVMNTYGTSNHAIIGENELSQTTYYTSMMRLNEWEKLLGHINDYDFNHHTHKLRIKQDFNTLRLGSKIGLYAKRRLLMTTDELDTTENEVYNDTILKKLSIAHTKKQWGSNLSKFGGIKMPGGIEFNGAEIMQDADKLIEEAKEDLIANYSDPIVPRIA